MQFTQDSHAAIAKGAITVTFRLWKRPHAKVGGLYAVGGVVIEVDAMEMMPFHAITTADVRRAGAPDRDALRARAAHAGPFDDENVLHVIAKLDAMDARAKGGPWTRRVLGLIDERPGTVSTELAAIVGRPRQDFKTDVRKLRALGLTESLESGYCLTPLGARVANE